MKTIRTFLGAVLLGSAMAGQAQTPYNAWDIQQVVKGNEDIEGYGVRNDFRVLQPITISSLGAFDSLADGIQGSAVITVQLYQLQSTPKGNLLLETVTFDAQDSGTLNGCFLYKPLSRPVTLLPGVYTIAASGFDKLNKNYNFTRPPSTNSYQPEMTLNTGGGLIQFLGCDRFHNGNPGSVSDQDKNYGPATRFAASTFTFAAAQPYTSPFAGDYAALTANVASFPVDGGKSNWYGSDLTLNRYGTIALLQDSAFPVIVEPSGDRSILEAGAYYNGDTNAARCVVFGHEQFGHAEEDNRMALFENAINWASRKSSRADIVLGVVTNLDGAYFASEGYQVRWINPNMKMDDTNNMTGCDVIVGDMRGRFSDRFYTRLSDFATNGGGVVMTFLPWRYVHSGVRPEFQRVNTFLQPYGIAYRSSLTAVTDLGFTNIQPLPYPPDLFNGFPAAALLRQDRQGQIQLDSLQKSIAMHTVAYAADRQPDRLAALTAVYTGLTNNGVLLSTNMGSFADVVYQTGAQASSNQLGQWTPDGTDLVCEDSRGGVEYDFSLPTADIYKLQVFGTQGNSVCPPTTFNFTMSLDGIDLGQFNMNAVAGVSGEIDSLTPYILPGPHTLRIFWNNVSVFNQLRLQSVHIQTAAGMDSTGSGIKDWELALVNDQSGMDLTNEILTSYTSPICLEGSDPYPSLINASVSGSDQNGASLMTMTSPNNRWFVNVPLASAGDALFSISYQNGAKTEQRSIQWLPVNVLDGGNYTIRAGDSLNLIAYPDGSPPNVSGSVQLTIGTNSYPTRMASSQMPHAFNEPGSLTVAGTYTDTNGTSQSGSMTVNVVGFNFATNPAVWTGMDREWDVFMPSTAIIDPDARLYYTQIAPLSGGGWANDLFIDESEPRYLLSRLGTNGPVLSAGYAKGFDFWHGADTYVRTMQTYSDGSQLVQMMLVMHPVLPDVTVELDVIVGGVVFLDGTTTKTLTAADFDAQGRCIVQFIRPASAKSSVCHSIKIWQGGQLVGYVL